MEHRSRSNPSKKKRDESGIALFIVITAVSLMSMIATEMTYVVQVNQKIAFDGLDQVKAHYLAKSGYKLSLLRIKTYQQAQTQFEQQMKSLDAGKGMLESIWSIPLFYPFPSQLPGMTPSDREKIAAFEKNTGLQGKFSAVIESESSKHNLNSLLASFEPAPEPSPSPSPSVNGNAAANTNPNPTPTPTFQREEAQKHLLSYLKGILDPKMESDPAFADAYRDPHLLEDLVDNITAWADLTHERRSQKGEVPMKQAPFYSLSELHMIPGMDDDLYDLFAPHLTVGRTPGVNVNKIEKTALRALFPMAQPDEITEFFKLRDNADQPSPFKEEADFWKRIGSLFKAYPERSLEDIKASFAKAGIRIITDEQEFKITVRAQVNQSVRTIEAWVSTQKQKKDAKKAAQPSNDGTLTEDPNTPNSGLKVYFMRLS